MKKFLRISWGADSTPIHLLGAVILAFLVMIYINTVIGSLGGVPAFIAFLFVYFLVRSVQSSGNRISHFIGISSKQEVAYLLRAYAIGYLVFYVIMKVVQVFAKISGWGNVEGMSISEYVSELFGTTTMEKWAYIFAFIYMMAFVLSLFPLVLIKKVKTFVLYSVCYVLVHAGVCFLIVLSCLPYIEHAYLKKARCLVDALLLRNISSPTSVAVYLIIALVYLLASVFVAYLFAVHIYSPKPGAPVKNPEHFRTYTREEITERRRVLYRRNWILGSISFVVVAVVGIICMYVFFWLPDDNQEYRKISECLTEDVSFGPMHYGINMYVPVDADVVLYEDGIALGYLGKKGENCSSRYYRLAIANILYQSRDSSNQYLQSYGMTEEHLYLPVSYLEAHPQWEEDEIFMIWDEDWESESLYSDDVTGYSICDRELVDALENEFGEVVYNLDDFAQYDSYFTLSGYRNIKDAFWDSAYPGDWVGCILVKDEKFYYGNLKNEITGETLELLMEAIGGAK